MLTFLKATINKVLAYFREMHSEGGNVSWMRTCGTIVIGTILVVFLAHNIAALSRGERYQDFGFESVGVILSVLGAKVWQRKNETTGEMEEVVELAANKPSTPEAEADVEVDTETVVSDKPTPKTLLS